MDTNMKEVEYAVYCSKCKHRNKKENEDPCWDCLTESFNENSHKPTYFEET